MTAADIVFVVAAVLVGASHAAILAVTRPVRAGLAEVVWVVLPALGTAALVVLAWRRLAE